MLTYVAGEIIYSPAQVLVNPVNTVGTMGEGLAGDFKRFYPDMFAAYRELCQADRLEIGQVFLWRTPHKWILNLPVRKHWRAEARLEYLEAGLQKFARSYATHNITSVSFPLALTEGPALPPAEVRPLLESYLGALPITIYLHEPDNPLETAPRNVRAMRLWLEGTPQPVTFDDFWRQVTLLARKAPFTTPDGRSITVQAAPRKGSERISLKLLVAGESSLYIPETQLQDLWQYVRRAGYILPRNLPGGLEQPAPVVMALLGQLPWLRPVLLAPEGEAPVPGLHYIPPVERKQPPLTATFTRIHPSSPA
ncbi:MAG: macro domain-containing protein [Anaerolineae bacterium]|jgi:O-acetyl-ADP-ribose deacetylase (regulator of RNase III)|nr:macro domain-containing protein [Anaerolineae bacterium]